MKKRNISLSTLILLALSISACGIGPGRISQPIESEPAQSVIKSEPQEESLKPSSENQVSSKQEVSSNQASSNAPSSKVESSSNEPSSEPVISSSNEVSSSEAPSSDEASSSEAPSSSEVPSSSIDSSSEAPSSSDPSSSSEPHVHSWDEWIITVAPTCINQGEETRICLVCNAEEKRTVAALGHDWDTGNITKHPTCTEPGVKTTRCSRCEETIVDEIPALGHDWDTGIVIVEPTADTEGVKQYTCQRCYETKNQSIPATGGQSSEEPEVDLTDVETSNVNIAFSELESNSIVTPKVKAYVDAMEAQEKTLDKPYHFSSLYGPDDYAKIAAASDKGDGTTYAAADKGGVDVCEMLSRNDYSNTAASYPITIKWNNGDLTFNSAKLKFWSTEDKSDLREVDLGANATSASLLNLYRARKYRAQLVTSTGEVSQGFEFKTGDYPRTITMGNIKNVRDIGGYMTSYGVRTTQGLIYRGYYIDDKSGGHGVNYSADAQAVQEEVMKIGYELDLQSSSETNGRTSSALNSAATPCDYKCLTLVSYENFLSYNSYKNLPEIFSILANSDQKHVYFHCWGGADRTGMLAFFINAICGVSYTDLIEDFEITTETNNKRCHMHNSSSAHFPKFLNAFINNWSGYDASQTINENCERWLLDVAGVSAENILRVRELMIPGYYDGMEQHIPTYTADTSSWETDDLAHWQVAVENPNVKCNWARHSGNPCTVCDHEGSGEEGGEGNKEIAVLKRNWDEEMTECTNSDGKKYYQLTDTSNKVVGVKISIQNYTVESDAAEGTVLNSSGKIDPVNDKSAILTYRIKAPKMGAYQMIMRGKGSSSGDGKTLADRHFTVTLNGTPIDIQSDRAPITLSYAEFVAAPTLNLTGDEDVIKITASDYRIIFDIDSYIIFAEQ